MPSKHDSGGKTPAASVSDVVSLSVSDVLQFTSSVDFKVGLGPSESRQLSTEQCRQHAAVNAEHRV